MPDSLVVWSGGLDSTVLLYLERVQDPSAAAISVDYGQRHRKELDLASSLAFDLGLDHVVADVSGLRNVLTGSALTDDAVDVPEGHYADPSMRSTVVPNRNAILLSVSIGRAIAIGASRVSYAGHAGDHAIYPDCRPAFVEAIGNVARLCSDSPIWLRSPFVRLTKTDVVRIGADLDVPFERTWSCYKGGERHCGRCGTCFERREAFADAGVPDPTEYEATA